MNCLGRQFTNRLSEFIRANPDCPLLDVLLDSDVGPLVRNESRDLVDYLVRCPASAPGCTRLYTLARWAVTDEWAAAADPARYRLAQPSRNAAAILSSPCKPLWTAMVGQRETVGGPVFGLLMHFLDGRDPSLIRCALDPVLSGHFERILEHFLSHGEEWIPEADRTAFYRSLIHFSLEHVGTLSYQQLLGRLLLDSPFVLVRYYGTDGKGGPDPEGDALERFVVEVLREAVRQTLVVEQHSRRVPQARVRVGAPAIVWAEDTRPLNSDRRPLRQAPVDREQGVAVRYRGGSEYCERLQARIARFGLAPPPPEPDEAVDCDAAPSLRASAYADARMHAYLLVELVQGIIYDNMEFVKILQRLPVIPPGDWNPADPHAWPLSILELLLAVGIYSDHTSLAAAAAFRLIRLIAFGFESFAKEGRDESGAHDDNDMGLDGPIESTPRSGEEAFERIVRAYAPDFLFAEPVTPQMLAAFRIFWNYRYPDLTDDSARQTLEVPLIDHTHRESPTVTWTWPEVTGRTPLEYLGHYVLYEPAVLDSFNRDVLLQLFHYEEECNKVRKKPINSSVDEQRFEYQRQLFEKEIVILDFFRTSFSFGDDHTDMTAMNWVVPLPPTDEYYVKVAQERRRAILNGIIVEFLLLVTEGELFSDFEGINQLFDYAINMIPGPKHLGPYKQLLQSGFQPILSCEEEDEPASEKVGLHGD
jgi:hypothetical protein